MLNKFNFINGKPLLQAQQLPEHPWPINSFVKTVKQPSNPNDFTPIGLRGRKWNQTGVISHISDSHGLCYQVMHSIDATKAYYSPEELELLIA